MDRKCFVEIVQEVLDSLPKAFRERIHNVAILVEDYPPEQRLPRRGARPRATAATNVLYSHVGPFLQGTAPARPRLQFRRKTRIHSDSCS
jgi:hypothetical protein